MMAKTENMIIDLWAIGLDRFPQYANSDKLLECYMEDRGVGMRKPSRQALIIILIRFFGFRECGHLHKERKLYYNPWHPNSPESQDDTKLIYPSWLEREKAQ